MKKYKMIRVVRKFADSFFEFFLEPSVFNFIKNETQKWILAALPFLYVFLTILLLMLMLVVTCCSTIKDIFNEFYLKDLSNKSGNPICFEVLMLLSYILPKAIRVKVFEPSFEEIKEEFLNTRQIYKTKISRYWLETSEK